MIILNYIFILLLILGTSFSYHTFINCEYCGDVVENPVIRPTGGLKEKSRFLRRKRNVYGGRYSCHYGIDILVEKNSPVRSIRAGRVWHVIDCFDQDKGKSRKRNNKPISKSKFGNHVIIECFDPDYGNIYILYAHLNEVHVSADEDVNIGQSVGLAGKTGNAFGLPDIETHVHVEVATNPKWRADQYCRGRKDSFLYCSENEEDCCDCAPYRIDPELFMKTSFDFGG